MAMYYFIGMTRLNLDYKAYLEITPKEMIKMYIYLLKQNEEIEEETEYTDRLSGM